MATDPNEVTEGDGEELDTLELTEKVEGEPNDEGDTPDPVSGIAAQMGWVPKDQFRGDEAAWKPAGQFILDGKDIQRNQARDLKDMRSTLSNIERTSAQILKDRVEQETNRLAQLHDQAVEDGDSKRAFEISKKITGLEQEPAKPQLAAEAQEWVQRNSWFNSDPLAQRMAVHVCNDLAHLPVGQQLEAAEREVRRAYPQLFGPPAKGPAGVSQPGGRSAAPTSRAKGVGDMPAAAQKIAKDMADRGVIPSADHYARNYWATEGKAS